MLVLGRKQMESIHIGQNITVTVLSVRGRTVRLGIDAPSEVSILRSELVPEDEYSHTRPADERQQPTTGVGCGSSLSG